MPPASLHAGLIRRLRPPAFEPRPALPVRDRRGGDLRFFLIAWAIGFITYFVLIA